MQFIHFEKQASQNKQVGIITLSRCDALNALNMQMIEALYSQLLDWSKDESILAVFIRSACEKAFCAGGDVRAIYHQRKQPPEELLRFFELEYRLNRLIGEYPKPYYALLNGITMGGGVGISMHGKRCIATERVRFAMPETRIGFFPDVGGSYLLSRCPGELGTYLALSGDVIQLDDLIYTGLVQHQVAAAELSNLFARLLVDPLQTLAPVHSSIDAPLSQRRNIIDRCFAHNSVEDILQALASENDAWCQHTLDSLKQKSPSSLKVSLALIRQAKQLSLADCLALDLRLTRHFIQQNDFFEGVRAALVDKDQQPNWQPNTLAEINQQQVEAYFA